jgi:predicted Zn-dependent protease
MLPTPHDPVHYSVCFKSGKSTLRIRRRGLFGSAAGCFLCGCAGAVHRLPQISEGSLSLAQGEITAAGGNPARRMVSDEEVLDTLRASLRRIRPVGEQLCREMKVGVCNWNFRILPDRSLNAGAGPNGAIVINRGIVEYAANEEEVALVLAHEMGHQAANHVASTQRNQALGALIGAVLLGAAGAAASRGSLYSADLARSTAETGASIGGSIGRITFSKEQEREADYLAAVVLYRSGVDLDRARGFLVTMARASGRLGPRRKRNPRVRWWTAAACCVMRRALTASPNRPSGSGSSTASRRPRPRRS